MTFSPSCSPIFSPFSAMDPESVAPGAQQLSEEVPFHTPPPIPAMDSESAASVRAQQPLEKTLGDLSPQEMAALAEQCANVYLYRLKNKPLKGPGIPEGIPFLELPRVRGMGPVHKITKVVSAQPKKAQGCSSFREEVRQRAKNLLTRLKP